MPMTRQPPHQSIEGDLRSVYRALGMSELDDKIGPDSKIGSDENPSPDASGAAAVRVEMSDFSAKLKWPGKPQRPLPARRPGVETNLCSIHFLRNDEGGIWTEPPDIAGMPRTASPHQTLLIRI
jgi:hypothetical protein